MNQQADFILSRPLLNCLEICRQINVFISSKTGLAFFEAAKSEPA